MRHSSVMFAPCCSAHNIGPKQPTIFIYLCSRTTGGPTIRNAILGFLDAYPTPSAVLGASNRELEECIGPLGLMEVRRKALQQMSHDFFAKVGRLLACLSRSLLSTARRKGVPLLWQRRQSWRRVCMQSTAGQQRVELGGDQHLGTQPLLASTSGCAAVQTS